MRTFVLAALTSLAFVAPSEAQERRRVGPWEITTERNRFDDGNDVIIALQIRQGMAFAVRCLAEKQFSLGLMEIGLGTGRMRRGMQTSAMVRIDRNPVERPQSGIVNDRLVQINFPIDKAEQLLRGREIAIRLEIDGGAGDHVFRLTQADRALKPVIDACKETPEPERHEADGDLGTDRNQVRDAIAGILRANQRTVQLPQLTCGRTVVDHRNCDGAISRNLRFAFYESSVGAPDDAFKKGEGIGRVTTVLVSLSDANQASAAEKQNHAAVCAAALAHAAGIPNAEALRRTEEATTTARRMAAGQVLGVGSWSSPKAHFEAEVQRINGAEAEVNCYVLARKN